MMKENVQVMNAAETEMETAKSEVMERQKQMKGNCKERKGE